jgi:murein DD-endopeptidase MepM/ murein hydrolase activator NlpD
MRIGLPTLLLLASCAVAAHPARRAWIVEGSAPQDAIDAGVHRRMVEHLHERADALVPARVKAGGVAPLAWPLQPAAGFTPFGYTGTAYFVDHDPAFPGHVRDYTCGARAYDTAAGYNHGGTDYYLWPFPWLLMDQGSVRVVAAAPGVIIEKHDGFFDRDCAIDFATGNAINAVYVLQDDGLTAWYLHLRKGSVTHVPVGTRVAAGDYLGQVGSSGPSSLPHLHFELTDDATGQVVDPRHGSCNAAPERWIVPQPYEAPRILGLSTHSAEPETVDCGMADGAPVRDSVHAQDRFRPGDTLWAFAAYADHRNGEVTAFTLLRPDGSTFAQWSFDLASENLEQPFYSGTAWDWSHTLPADAPLGEWTLQAVFAGQTYRHSFTVAPAIEPNQRGLSGSWANPATPGQGVLLDVQEDYYGAGTGLLFGGWFSYDSDPTGDRRWYTLQAQVHAGSATTTTPIYQTTGGRFATTFTTTTNAVGEATLRFDDCTHGTLQYLFTDGSARSGTIPLTRLLANVSCTPSGDSGTATGVDLRSGTWADPANSGQGLVLDINSVQRVVFGAWYTFSPLAGATTGPAGQRWYTLQVPLQDGPVVDNIGLYETSGGVFDSGEATSTVPIGGARLEFNGCSAATLDYAFNAGADGRRSGRLNLVRVTAPPPGCF